MKFRWLSAIAKPIGLLLLLLNVQLNIDHKAAEAKNVGDFICPAELETSIDRVIGRSQFSRGRWGIVIQTLSSAQTLYSREAEKYFIPASNVKLLTTAAVLQQLGSQFRIRTSVYGTANGSLRVVGRGDPSLSDVQITDLAQQLSRRGIRQVNQLITEDNYFRGSVVNSSWEWEDVQADYGAPVNSLILNQNTVELALSPQKLGEPVKVTWADPQEALRWRIKNDAVTVPSGESAIAVSWDLAGPSLKITGQMSVGSEPEKVGVAVIDPVGHFLGHFRRALAVVGINVNADISQARTLARRSTQRSNFIREPSAFAELAAVESPPLSQLLIETNHNSNNLYAEALLRILGAKAGNNPDSNEVGLAVVKATLTKLGVEPSGYVLADGSGLSRHNLVSPEAIAQTLRAMARSQEAFVYRASLPVAGISGTLKNRFRDTAAQGIWQAKTGTMSGVVALSGYLNIPNYEPLVVSIIVNQSDRPAETLRQASDEIVLLLTRLHHC